MASILEDWSWPWSAQTLSLHLFKLEDKITALQWACCAENQGLEPRFPEWTASHSGSPSLSIHPSTSHLTERERETETSRDRERHLAVNSGLAGFSWTAVSNKVSRLKEKGRKNGVLHNNPAVRERQQRRKRGMNDGEILLKSLNDRGQFLLTRRKKVQWVYWLVGYSGLKSWLIGSQRILLCLFRSIAYQKSFHPTCIPH